MTLLGKPAAPPRVEPSRMVAAPAVDPPAFLPNSPPVREVAIITPAQRPLSPTRFTELEREAPHPPPTIKTVPQILTVPQLPVPVRPVPVARVMIGEAPHPVPVPRPPPPPPPPPVYVPPKPPPVIELPPTFPKPVPITIVAPPKPPQPPPPIIEGTPEMSLLGKLGSGLKTVGKIAIGGVTGGLPGAAVAAASAFKKSPTNVATFAGLPSLPTTTVGRVATGFGIGAGIQQLTRGLTGASGCGCNGKSGRDPCTGQKMTSQRAPEASFFGGCCPPGRVLRRTSWGRDICMRKPRMNPFNPAALARADRRLTSFGRRSTVILRDMGFQVSRTRKPKFKIGKKRARR